MATRAEIKRRIIDRYIARTDITAPQLLSALTTLTEGERIQFLIEVNSNRPEQAGRAILLVRKRFLESQAEAEAEAILADDTISFDELDKVL